MLFKSCEVFQCQVPSKAGTSMEWIHFVSKDDPDVVVHLRVLITAVAGEPASLGMVIVDSAMSASACGPAKEDSLHEVAENVPFTVDLFSEDKYGNRQEQSTCLIGSTCVCVVACVSVSTDDCGICGCILHLTYLLHALWHCPAAENSLSNTDSCHILLYVGTGTCCLVSCVQPGSVVIHYRMLPAIDHA